MPPNSKLVRFNSGQSWGGDLRNVSSPQKEYHTLITLGLRLPLPHAHKSFHAKVRVSNPRFTLFTRPSPSNPFPGHHSLDTARRRRPPSVLALAPSPPAPLIPVLSPSLAYSLPRSLLHDLAHSPHVLAPSPSPLLLPPHTGAAGRRHLRLGDICRGD